MNKYQDEAAKLADLNAQLNGVTSELYELYANETIENERSTRARKLELEAKELELEQQIDVIYDAVDC